jgi:hypothetical protein
MALVDQQEQAAQERVAAARKAEGELLEMLQHRGLVDQWKIVKTGLHCEKFLESRTGKAVVDRLIRTILDAQNTWLLADDPRAPEVVSAHRTAQAAHMALFALDEAIGDGEQARIELERISQELGGDE